MRGWPEWLEMGTWMSVYYCKDTEQPISLSTKTKLESFWEQKQMWKKSVLLTDNQCRFSRIFERPEMVEKFCSSLDIISLLPLFLNYARKRWEQREKNGKWWRVELMFGHWLNVSSQLGIQPPWHLIFMTNLWPPCADPSRCFRFHQCKNLQSDNPRNI